MHLTRQYLTTIAASVVMSFLPAIVFAKRAGKSNVRSEQEKIPPITLVLNWAEGLRK